MSVKQIRSDKAFKKIMDAEVALVDFNAPWCAPCHVQEPILANVSEEMAGKAIVAAVNIDNHLRIARAYDIRNIPTLIVFKKGEELERFVGLQNGATLVNAMVRALNRA